MSSNDWDSRTTKDRDDRYPRGDDYDRDRDYNKHNRDVGSRSSSSSSKLERRTNHHGGRSNSRSRSRSQSRTRSRSRSGSSGSYHRRSGGHRRGGDRDNRQNTTSRSRSRSRDRYDYNSRSPRPDDEYGRGRYYQHDDRRAAEDVKPNSILMVRGLPPEWDEPVLWTLLAQDGFTPKDIRIMKWRDTGQGRGFGFVEFLDVDEATRWMDTTKGRLKIDDRTCIDIQYSKTPHATTTKAPPIPETPASALAAAALLAQRLGDWICGNCGTNNFRKRDVCFKCNLTREESNVEGISETSAEPCDTLVLMNLPSEIDEDKILYYLKKRTALDIVRIVVARNPTTEETRGFAYVQLANANDATQFLTALTTLTPLKIEDNEISAEYSKQPLTVVLTGANLTQGTPGAAAWSATAGGLSGIPGASQTDGTNAAAAVAQNAMKKAHVLRAAAQHVQAAQLASLRAATMLIPTPALLLQHQQILAAQALHEMATVQLFQEHVKRSQGVSTSVDLGTVQTPHGELPRYPIPEVHKFQFDHATGFYFDATTGLHYDPKSTYFYNSETRQYLYWDAPFQTYLPAPTSSEGETSKPTAEGDQQQQQATTSAAEKELPRPHAPAPGAAAGATAGGNADNSKAKKKPDVPEKKVTAAKKIQEQMDKWAKQLNQRKEPHQPAKAAPAMASIVAESASSVGSSAAGLSNEEKSSGSADTAFQILRSTGGLKGALVSYDGGGDSDDEHPKLPTSSFSSATQPKPKIDESELVNWSTLACLLCRRKFNDKDVLTKHIQFSDLHKNNLMVKMQQNEETESHSGGIQYRDRAKERRDKFGIEEDKRGKPTKGFESKKSVGQEHRRAIDSESVSAAGPSTSGGGGMGNIGSKLMKGMGWQEGQGLGRSNQGIVDPITAHRRVQGAGLGASGSVVSVPASASYKDHVKAAMRQKFYQDSS